jgi:hypothetical protein
MKTAARIALLFCAALSAWGVPNYSQSLTITHAQCGSSDSSNFPVLVKLSGNNYKTRANGGLVENSSGYDILFWSDSGLTSALTWEMDLYDGTNGVVWAWVKETCNHTTDQVFYVSFGDTTITTFQSTASSVWSNGYDYVWHGGDGTTLGLTDSTTNANSATNSATPVTATTGQIAGGGAFVAASTEFLLVDTDPAALQPTTITISMWVNFTSTTGTRYVIRKLGNGYRLFGVNSGTGLSWGVFDSGGAEATTTTPSSINDGTWRYLVATFNGTSSCTAALKLYSNGVAGNTANCTSTGNIKYTAGSVDVGANGGASSWQGSIDEVHVATGVRSADWITAEYNNQSNPGSFITVGALNTANPAPGTRGLLGVGR